MEYVRTVPVDVDAFDAVAMYVASKMVALLDNETAQPLLAGTEGYGCSEES